IGLKKWIDRQLHPERIPENPELLARLRPLETLTMSTADLAAKFPPRAGLAPRQAIAFDLSQAKLLRAVYSSRQLEEQLADFWYNHFNVFFDKGQDRYFVTAYERDTIRPRVLGKFKDLLAATAQDPAMLFYLDNWQSVAPSTRQPRGRPARGLNENYARELLE